VNKDQLSQAKEAWDFSFQGHSSEATGARDGCSSSGDESMAEPGATGERKPPLAPDASELSYSQDAGDPRRLVEPVRESLVECPGCSSQRLSDDQPITTQAKGLEPPRVPVEGRGEKGGGGEGFDGSKASLPQNTGERGSTRPVEAHVCSKTAENDVPPARESYYAHYSAKTHKNSERSDATGNADWSMAVPDIPKGASAMDVLRAYRNFRDEGFQAHFYRPPEAICEPDTKFESLPEIIDELCPGEDVATGAGCRGPRMCLASVKRRDELPQMDYQLELFCTRYAKVGTCEHGHTYAKELICNREWCDDVNGCGGIDGKAHQRRKARWFSKLRQMAKVGSLVTTLPPEVRDSFREKYRVVDDNGEYVTDEDGEYIWKWRLSDFSISITRFMKREGFSRGLRRWHFFGDDHQGSGLQGDGMPPFHPHLNMLFEAGHIDELCPGEDKASGKGCRGPGRCLSRIKRFVAKSLKVDLSRINVHYEYTDKVPEMIHLMNYVLRPTFTDARWDVPLTTALKGFRNAVPWGKWDDDPVWDVPESEDEDVPNPETESLEHGLCPIDETPIAWNPGVVRTSILRRGEELGQCHELADGYWKWNDVARAPPT